MTAIVHQGPDWKTTMIYEMRVYNCVPGRMGALMERFANHTCGLFEKHGIRQAGFFTTLVGASHNQLTYLLAWESMAEREVKWAAFVTDPAWIAVRDASEKDGPIIASITNQLLSPTAFSAVK